MTQSKLTDEVDQNSKRGLCIAGKHAKKSVYFYFKEKYMEFASSPSEIIRFNEITSVNKNDYYEKNHGIEAFILTFISITSVMIYYNYETLPVIPVSYYVYKLDWTSILLNSLVSGVIWGGAAFVLGYIIKKQMPAYTIKTTSNNEYKIALDPIDEQKFIKQLNDNSIEFVKVRENKPKQEKSESKTINKKPELEKKDISITSSSKAIEYFDHLVKLKDLLDKGILTNEEFESEKSKIIN